MLIVFKFHDFGNVRYVSIKRKDNTAECPSRSVITIVEEGFLDDQLRGKWKQFHFARNNCEDYWKITEVREAYLCGISGSKEVFLKELCPNPFQNFYKKKN
ncbi:hypothetical protein [Thermodesulfovibrio hydrogeniphilus]